MVDSVYRTRSLGVAAQGLPDQYADGRAAKVWEYYIGQQASRTEQYKEWICHLLRHNGCINVLDVACGTGTDSIMLLEEGFKMTSVDASDKMLKYALKKRWNRRHEEPFDKWVIEEANWLSLVEDMEIVSEKPKDGYDAVICLGNSFAHLPDFDGNQLNHKEALTNFHDMIKEGGVLIIDHRNYDEILRTGLVPEKNIYYNSEHVTDIKCSNLYVNGRPNMVTLDYVMEMPTDADLPQGMKTKFEYSTSHKFRLSYYPHCLDKFTSILKEVFGANSKQEVYGDFKPIGELEYPAYYIHVIHK